MNKASAQPRYYREWVLCGIFGLIIALVFGSTIYADFVQWDDDINIYGNPSVQGLTAPNLYWMFTDAKYVRRYMPLGWLSWAVDFELYGKNPAGYHLGNLFLHYLNTILVFLILRKLFRAAQPQLREEISFMTAAVGALIWAVHPLRVEPVAWASGRLYCQASCLLLLCLFSYLKFTEGGSRRRRWYGLALAAYAASLLTYPIGLALLPVLVILDYYPLWRCRGGWRAAWEATARKVWAEKLQFVAIALAMFGLTIACRIKATGLWSPPVTLEAFGIHSRDHAGFLCLGLLCLADLATARSRSALWNTDEIQSQQPDFSGECPAGHWAQCSFHSSTAPMAGGPGDVGLLPRASGSDVRVDRTSALRERPLQLLARNRLCRRNCRAAAALGLVAPENQRPKCSRNTGRARPSPAAPALPAAVGQRPAHLWQRRARIVCAALVLALFAFLSFAQCKIWKSSDTLFLHFIDTLGKHPRVADIYQRLGTYRLSIGDYGGAEEAFRQAIVRQPKSLLLRAHLGNAMAFQDKMNEAITIYENVIAQAPGHRETRINLAHALAETGRRTEAEAHYRDLLARAPEDGRAHLSYAKFLAGEGRLKEALSEYQETKRLLPDTDLVYVELGRILIQQGETAQAVRTLREGLKRSPNAPGPLLALAWIYATNDDAEFRNGADAIALAARANRLTGGEHPGVLDTLAAAYAEGQRYADAVRAAEHAVRVAAGSPREKGIRARLQLYARAGLIGKRPSFAKR